MEAPCKECADRRPLCHSECEAYRTFRAEKDRQCAERETLRHVHDIQAARRERDFGRYQKRKMKR